MYALCGLAKAQRGTCCWRAVLARIVPHTLMIVFLISRFDCHQPARQSMCCVFVGEWLGVRFDSDSPSTNA